MKTTVVLSLLGFAALATAESSYKTCKTDNDCSKADECCAQWSGYDEDGNVLDESACTEAANAQDEAEAWVDENGGAIVIACIPQFCSENDECREGSCCATQTMEVLDEIETVSFCVHEDIVEYT